MKRMKLSALLLGSLALAQGAAAAVQVTAAQHYEGKTLFLGLRRKTQGHTEATALLRMDAKDLQTKTIKLPPEVAGREIVAILPSSRLVVLVTQLTNGGGDAPLVHILSLQSSRWRKAAKVACPSPNSIRVKGDTLVFACAPDYTKADSPGKDYEKTVSLGAGVNLGQHEIKFPQQELTLKGVEIAPVQDGTITVGLKLKGASQNERTLSFEEMKF